MLEITRVTDPASPDFAGLVAVYEGVIPASERKDRATLRRMLENDRCVFLVARQDDGVVGFSIQTICETAWLSSLEYMGVTPAFQGRGFGQLLFAAVSDPARIGHRPLLIEVESEADAPTDAERDARIARKRFYRRLGCGEIASLVYRMPPLGGGSPPAMRLLAGGTGRPDIVEKGRLREWLGAIYSEVYGRPGDDPAIEEMIAGLPEKIAIS